MTSGWGTFLLTILLLLFCASGAIGIANTVFIAKSDLDHSIKVGVLVYDWVGSIIFLIIAVVLELWGLPEKQYRRTRAFVFKTYITKKGKPLVLLISMLFYIAAFGAPVLEYYFARIHGLEDRIQNLAIFQMIFPGLFVLLTLWNIILFVYCLIYYCVVKIASLFQRAGQRLVPKTPVVLWSEKYDSMNHLIKKASKSSESVDTVYTSASRDRRAQVVAYP